MGRKLEGPPPLVPHHPQAEHLCSAGPATCCLAGHEACLGASVASQARGWDMGWALALGAGKLRVGPRLDIYSLTPLSHWDACIIISL